MPISFSGGPSTRLGLPRPDYPDTPVDLVDLFNQRDAIIDFLASIDSGPLSSRPVSTSSSPGKKRRMFLVEGEPDSPRLDMDYGTGWITLGPDPATTSYFEVACTGPAGLYLTALGLVIPYNTVIIDVASAWHLISETEAYYTVPSTGVYFFTASVSLLYTSGDHDGSSGSIFITQNGTTKVNSFEIVPLPGIFKTWKTNSTFFCTKGDKIRVVGSVDPTVSHYEIQGGTAQTRFSGARVS